MSGFAAVDCYVTESSYAYRSDSSYLVALSQFLEWGTDTCCGCRPPNKPRQRNCTVGIREIDKLGHINSGKQSMNMCQPDYMNIHRSGRANQTI